MGVANFQSACELIESNSDLCDFAGERDERLIGLAEETLGLSFPPSYRLFLQRFGAGNVGAEEIYGVIDEDFFDSAVPDGVWMTLRGRQEWGLPDDMVVVYFDGATGYFALDTGAVREDGECPVVAWYPGRSTAGDVLDVMAADFGGFLLEIATRELV